MANHLGPESCVLLRQPFLQRGDGVFDRVLGDHEIATFTAVKELKGVAKGVICFKYLKIYC